MADELTTLSKRTYHVFAMLTAQRLMWCEDRPPERAGAGRGLVFMEQDCVTDDHGCLVPVQRRENERPGRHARGWSYQVEVAHG